MPKKNSIGMVLMAIGITLSASLYLTLWMIKPQGLFENITINLQDTYLTLHPIFILAGFFSVCSNLLLIGVQLFKRFKFNTWNTGQLFSLIMLGGFILYGREVLRFGFAFIGRRLDLPSQEWTLNHNITYTAGRWEKLLQKAPEALVVIVTAFILVLVVRSLVIKRRNKSLN